jgi:hypothetical protein
MTGTLALWFFVGGVNADKEGFPLGSKVTVLQEGKHLPGTIMFVPLSDQKDYTVVLNESPINYLVPLQQLTGEGEPVFHMISMEPGSPVSTAPPKIPEWIEDNTHITIHHDGREHRGMLQSTDQEGWTFIQRTASGRTTFTLDMADLPVSWEERITEGSLELGWQAQARAYHVSAKGITHGIPPSFRKSMEMGYPDRRLWIKSYVEEVMGLKSQDTYVVISAKDYKKNHSDIQIIATMNIQTIKKDEVGDPDRVKSRMVALGNFEDRVWSKSEKYAPVLRDESSRAMTSMAVEMGRREKQGDARMLSSNPISPRTKPSSADRLDRALSANLATCGFFVRLFTDFDEVHTIGTRTLKRFYLGWVSKLVIMITMFSQARSHPISPLFISVCMSMILSTSVPPMKQRNCSKSYLAPSAKWISWEKSRSFLAVNMNGNNFPTEDKLSALLKRPRLRTYWKPTGWQNVIPWHLPINQVTL